MSQAKYQHYTPQLHLRQFRGESPRKSVWEYDKVRLVATPKATEKTGGQRYLYSVKNAHTGEMNHDLDHFLTGVEDRAAAGYDQLLKGLIPEGQPRADFAAFLATMYTRSPGSLRTTAETFGRLTQIETDIRWSSRDRFESSLDEIEAKTGKAIDDRDGLWAFWRDKSGFSLNTSIQMGLIALGASDKISPILYDREWCLLDAAEGYFITSDQAVERWVPRVHPIMGDGGFMNPTAEITFPLSPSRMLLISGIKPPAVRVAIAQDQVDLANALRARHAERFLWADRRDDRVLDLAKEFADGQRAMHVGWGEQLADVVVERSLRGRPT